MLYWFWDSYENLFWLLFFSSSLSLPLPLPLFLILIYKNKVLLWHLHGKSICLNLFLVLKILFSFINRIISSYIHTYTYSHA